MLNAVKIRDGHDNFFTPLRLLFAVLVVIGHSYAVALRDPMLEPHIFYHYTFSYLAVNMFFIASGFLVTKSMLYRGDSAEFSSARLLRIYPALIVHVLFVMFIIGPLATSLPLHEFLEHPQLLIQPLLVLTFIETNMVMPGAFTSNAEQLGSAPLWTLRYELLAYIGTGLAFALGFMRRKWMILCQFVGCALLWVGVNLGGFFDSVPATVQGLLRFGVSYGLGAAIYAYRDRLKFHLLGIPLIGVLTAMFNGTAFFEVAMNIWLAYSVFWAAYVIAPKLKWMQNFSDISYGIYIYHWCILQTVFLYLPNLGMISLLFITLPITIFLAYLSWHIIEKPMLARKISFARYLRFGRSKPHYDASQMLMD